MTKNSLKVVKSTKAQEADGKEKHKALEGVKQKSEQEGKFMVLREEMSDGEGEEEGKEEQEGGITIGGDISFYECDYKTDSQQKNPERE